MASSRQRSFPGQREQSPADRFALLFRTSPGCAEHGIMQTTMGDFASSSGRTLLWPRSEFLMGPLASAGSRAHIIQAGAPLKLPLIQAWPTLSSDRHSPECSAPFPAQQTAPSCAALRPGRPQPHAVYLCVIRSDRAHSARNGNRR